MPETSIWSPRPDQGQTPRSPFRFASRSVWVGEAAGLLGVGGCCERRRASRQLSPPPPLPDPQPHACSAVFPALPPALQDASPGSGAGERPGAPSFPALRHAAGHQDVRGGCHYGPSETSEEGTLPGTPDPHIPTCASHCPAGKVCGWGTWPRCFAGWSVGDLGRGAGAGGAT